MGKWTAIAEAAIEVLASMRRGALPADEAARMARRKRTDDLRAEANALRFGDSYKMQHTAPDAGSSPTGEDLSDVFPDIYGPMGKRYYGTSSPYDDEAISKIQTMRGNPDSEITIYRAVPQDVKEINPGDWVTTTKEYAVDHIGTDDGYTVISKKVKAGELANNGDSIHEFGFSPKALPTDEASRMARAQEMGFDETPLFHGTSNDITEFVVKKNSTGEFGPAVYLTTSPGEAAGYAGTHRGGQNVMPVMARLKNPMKVGSPDEFWQKFGAGTDDAGAVAAAKKAGHDGVIIERPVRQWDETSKSIIDTGETSQHYIVFDPSNVRSRFAQFDPAKAGSADILAGLAGLGVLGAGAAALPQDDSDMVSALRGM